VLIVLTAQDVNMVLTGC